MQTPQQGWVNKVNVRFNLPAGLTIKAAIFTAEGQELLVRLIGRCEDENPSVETVWPTRVRGCRELLPLKELVYVGQRLKKKTLKTFQQQLNKNQDHN